MTLRPQHPALLRSLSHSLQAQVCVHLCWQRRRFQRQPSRFRWRPAGRLGASAATPCRRPRLSAIGSRRCDRSVGRAHPVPRVCRRGRQRARCLQRAHPAQPPAGAPGSVPPARDQPRSCSLLLVCRLVLMRRRRTESKNTDSQIAGGRMRQRQCFGLRLSWRRTRLTSPCRSGT